MSHESNPEPIGFRLEGGPFAGHTNAYPWPDGWPPPEQVIAFTVRGQVAIATVEHEALARMQFGDVTRYRKVGQSQLDQPVSHVLRGATYEVVEAE